MFKNHQFSGILVATLVLAACDESERPYAPLPEEVGENPAPPISPVVEIDYEAQAFKAVQFGDLKALKESLNKGVSVDLSDSSGLPLVYLATLEGHIELTKFLFRKGAKADSQQSGVQSLPEYILQSYKTNISKEKYFKYSTNIGIIPFLKNDQATNQEKINFDLGIVKMFLDRGSNPLKISSDGETIFAKAFYVDRELFQNDLVSRFTSELVAKGVHLAALRRQESDLAKVLKAAGPSIFLEGLIGDFSKTQYKMGASRLALSPIALQGFIELLELLEKMGFGAEDFTAENVFNAAASLLDPEVFKVVFTQCLAPHFSGYQRPWIHAYDRSLLGELSLQVMLTPKCQINIFEQSMRSGEKCFTDTLKNLEYAFSHSQALMQKLSGEQLEHAWRGTTYYGSYNRRLLSLLLVLGARIQDDYHARSSSQGAILAHVAQDPYFKELLEKPRWDSDVDFRQTLLKAHIEKFERAHGTGTMEELPDAFKR